jgi:hypothetical protein
MPQDSELIVVPHPGEKDSSEKDAGLAPEHAALQTRSSVSGIASLRARLSRWLSVPPEDQDLIDFSLAVYKSNEIPGDPLWGMIIDASGAGKTELLRAFRHRRDVYCLSHITEKTLISGYRNPSCPQKDPSLLLELDGKVLIIKDLAPLLSMRRESRDAIFAQLRDAYDGFTDHGRGNIGKVTYEARFTLLTAATLAIERFDAIDQELGERFIKIRSRGDGGRAKVRMAIGNIGEDDDMREDIERSISSFLDSLCPLTSARIPVGLQERLGNLSDFTARARSPVARNRNGELQYVPKAEVGTRLGKELGKLLLALAAVHGKSEPGEEEFRVVRRVAEDCLPPNRLLVIKALRDSEEPMTPSDVEEICDLAHTTTRRTLDDLSLLGAIDWVGLRGSWAVRLKK